MLGRSFPHTLYFIRHGETDWNVAGRLQGHTDTPLNGRGRAQAQSIGHYLKKVGVGAPFFVSPLLRTRQTADLIGSALGQDTAFYTTDPRLIEIGFGTWEGLNWHEIGRKYPDLVAARTKGKWHFLPPQGESYAQVAQRVSAFLEQCPQEACLVSHGGIGRVLLHLFAGQAPEAVVGLDIPQGRVLKLTNGAATWLDL